MFCNKLIILCFVFSVHASYDDYTPEFAARPEDGEDFKILSTFRQD